MPEALYIRRPTAGWRDGNYASMPSTIACQYKYDNRVGICTTQTLKHSNGDKLGQDDFTDCVQEPASAMKVQCVGGLYWVDCDDLTEAKGFCHPDNYDYDYDYDYVYVVGASGFGPQYYSDYWEMVDSLCDTPDPTPSPTPPLQGPTICENTCQFNGVGDQYIDGELQYIDLNKYYFMAYYLSMDDYCDDGGVGSDLHTCVFGTDCKGCGPRELRH